jgi:hypothetical protein
MGIKAFELNPLSEPYPTETLYESSAGFVQIDAGNGLMYFTSGNMLRGLDISQLESASGEYIWSYRPSEFFEWEEGGTYWDPTPPEETIPYAWAIGWTSESSKGGDALAAPHEAPQFPALASGGIYAAVARYGVRYEENLCYYAADGSAANEFITDITARNIFSGQDALFFRYDKRGYDSYNDFEPGIYMVRYNGAGVKLFDDGTLDFTVCETSPETLTLVLAGSPDDDRLGLYTAEIDQKTGAVSELRQIYDKDANQPNIAAGYIYFLANSEREGELLDYCRVALDGLTPVERLDFSH